MNKSAVIFMLLASVIVFGSCAEIGSKAAESTEPPAVEVNAGVQNAEDGARVLYYNVFVEDYGIETSKFEPEYGCYAGFYGGDGSEKDIAEIEERLGEQNALYGRSFYIGENPLMFILECMRSMRTPVIVMEPPEEDDIFDEEALLMSAKAVGMIDTPVFVVFYPVTEKSEFRAEEYREFFKKAYECFGEQAENAAIVWNVSAGTENFDDFFPGAEYVDWVGAIIYSNAFGEGVFEKTDGIYYLYQKSKPLFVMAGISHYSTDDNKYYEEEAADFIKNFYFVIRKEYPRIKAVLYINEDNVAENFRDGGNNFLVTDEDGLSRAYAEAVFDSYFIKEAAENVVASNRPQMIKSAHKAAKTEDRYYISENTVRYDLGLPQGLESLKGAKNIGGFMYYDAARVLPAMGMDFFENSEIFALYLRRDL